MSMNHSLSFRLSRMSKKVDECLIWTGQKSTSGYGRIRYNNKDEYAHRLSFLLHYGYLPKEPYMVLHTRNCTSKLCINPMHLYEGSQSSNMQDHVVSNNFRVGCRGKRNLASMKFLLDLGISQKGIAKKLNVHRRTIWKWTKELNAQENGGA